MGEPTSPDVEQFLGHVTRLAESALGQRSFQGRGSEVVELQQSVALMLWSGTAPGPASPNQGMHRDWGTGDRKKRTQLISEVRRSWARVFRETYDAYRVHEVAQARLAASEVAWDIVIRFRLRLAAGGLLLREMSVDEMERLESALRAVEQLQDCIAELRTPEVAVLGNLQMTPASRRAELVAKSQGLAMLDVIGVPMTARSGEWQEQAWQYGLDACKPGPPSAPPPHGNRFEIEMSLRALQDDPRHPNSQVSIALAGFADSLRQALSAPDRRPLGYEAPDTRGRGRPTVAQRDQLATRLRELLASECDGLAEKGKKKGAPSPSVRSLERAKRVMLACGWWE